MNKYKTEWLPTTVYGCPMPQDEYETIYTKLGPGGGMRLEVAKTNKVAFRHGIYIKTENTIVDFTPTLKIEINKEAATDFAAIHGQEATIDAILVSLKAIIEKELIK